MEAEDDDFGELYFDVLKPFYPQPSPKINNVQDNQMTDGKLETCSTGSTDIRFGNVEKGKEVVGTVRLEIFLGTRRVLENKFEFSVGEHGEVGQAENDSGFNQSRNLVTDGRNEMNSVQEAVNHSQCQRYEKVVACDAGLGLNSDPELVNDSSPWNHSERVGMIDVGDSNYEPEHHLITDGDGKMSGTPEGEINQNKKVIDRTSSVDMEENSTGGKRCKNEPSEEGQLSEYAELDSDREMGTIAATSNFAEEAGIGYNKLQYTPYKSPQQNVRHVTTTAFGQAVDHMTNLKPYRHQPKNKFPGMSTSLFDVDLDSLEHKPWRNQGVEISDYFNFGLDEATWKIYCEEIKTIRRYTGKVIQVEHGNRNHPSSVKSLSQWQRDSTSTIQIVAQYEPSTLRQPGKNKCYRPPELECIEEGSCGSHQGKHKQSIHQGIFAGMKGDLSTRNDNNFKRSKIMEDTARDSSSNMSDNEWMCRHVGIDSWFHPISMPEHQETKRKGSRRGRSKQERWTRHDRDNDDDSTSTSLLSSTPEFSNAGTED